MQQTHLIATEFLAVLRREGYALGVDKYLQIETLLQNLPDSTDTEGLKFALVPLLAHSVSEQEKLYIWLDAAAKKVAEKQIEIEKSTPSVSDDKTDNNSPKVKNLWRVLGAILLLVAIVGIGFLANKYFAKPTQVVESQIDTINQNQIQNPNDTLITNNKQPITTTEASPFVENKPYPFPNHLDDYDLDISPMQLWLAENWAWLRWLLALAWTAALVGLWWYRAWKRRQLVAQHDPTQKPPYFWNIHIEGADALLDVNDTMQRVSNLMRRREDTETLRLDMPRTIQATVEKGGSPDFRFRQQSRPSEYLLLIDRQSIRNHRARLFDTLYNAFRAQEVEISRYFYDSDVRICFDEAHPYGISIADVQQRHYQARLIVVGTGAQLLSPLSGKTAAWTPIFQQWKDRVLLSPKPLQSWSYDERQLSALFTTLPATMDGLQFWIEELEMGADARFETWRDKINDAHNAPIQPDDADPMPVLQLYFEPPVLRWIAACAIYPTLHWDLTLWLGNQVTESLRKPSRLPKTEDSKTEDAPPLSNFQNLRELSRLKWFVEGEMPDATRAAMLNWLEKVDPILLQNIRLALATELSKNEPPKDSVAYEPFRMTVAVNQWLATTDAAEKKQLEQEIADRLAQGAEPDFTVLKYLDKPRSPLDFVVPQAWRRFVYPNGFRGLGFLRELRDLWWLVVLLLAGLVVAFYPFNFIGGCSKDKIVRLVTEGKKVHYFCLDNSLSELTYNEYLESQRIVERRLSELEFFVRTSPISEGIADAIAPPITPNDSKLKKLFEECRFNWATDFYHLASNYYKENNKDSACLALQVAVFSNFDDRDIQRTRQLICNIKPNIVLEENYQLFKENNLFGYRNSETKAVLIPPQYDEARLFLEGLAAVKLGGKWGFIDTKNNRLIEPQFGLAYNFTEGLALVMNFNNQYGYIDKTGGFKIPPQYAVAERFKNGIARVKRIAADTWFCIDKTGKTVDCTAFSAFQNGECVTVQHSLGLSSRLTLRSRMLTNVELNAVNQRIKDQRENTTSLATDKATNIAILTNGEAVTFLGQTGNWYKVKTATGTEGYLVATYSGVNTLKKGCNTVLSTSTNQLPNLNAPTSNLQVGNLDKTNLDIVENDDRKQLLRQRDSIIQTQEFQNVFLQMKINKSVGLKELEYLAIKDTTFVEKFILPEVYSSMNHRKNDSCFVKTYLFKWIHTDGIRKQFALTQCIDEPLIVGYTSTDIQYRYNLIKDLKKSYKYEASFNMNNSKWERYSNSKYVTQFREFMIGETKFYEHQVFLKK